MEFYDFANITVTPEDIRDKLSLGKLPTFCEEIEAVDKVDEMGRVIFFRQWGRFHIRCEHLMDGLRFSVPDCPNALAWTVTTGHLPYPEKVSLHATINRSEHTPEFIDATKALLSSLRRGLERNFSSAADETFLENTKIQDLVDLRKMS